MDFHPKLTAAIEENFKWIRKKCLISEWDRVKREELINEVLYNLYESNKYFIKQTDVTPIAWVKRVTTNVTSKYVQDEKRENQFFDKEALDLDRQSQTSSQEVHDLRIVSEFMKKNFSIKDQEIMNLHLMQESHADIAQIMGLETATITNRISILKKELNEKFRQDHI